MEFDILGLNPLTVLVFGPGLSALIIAALPNNKVLSRWLSLALSLVIAAVAVAVFANYNNTFMDDPNVSAFQFQTQAEWFTLLG